MLRTKEGRRTGKERNKIRGSNAGLKIFSFHGMALWIRMRAGIEREVPDSAGRWEGQDSLRVCGDVELCRDIVLSLCVCVVGVEGG